MTEGQLQKVINMAKLGTGHEKTNAENIIRKYCKEKNLNFDSVMNGHNRGGDPNPFTYTWTYTSSNTSGNPYNASYEAMRQQRERQSRAWKDMMERMKKGQWEQQQNRTRVVQDKFGHQWEYNHLSRLKRETRIDLFGRDPLEVL